MTGNLGIGIERIIDETLVTKYQAEYLHVSKAREEKRKTRRYIGLGEKK